MSNPQLSPPLPSAESMASRCLPFPELAQRFNFTADPEECSNALEFLTTPTNQSSTTKESKRWQDARHTLLTFVAYLSMVSEDACETFQQWPPERRAGDTEAEEVHQSVLRTCFGPSGEFNFPETTFTRDTIVYFRKVNELFSDCYPLENLHQVLLLSVVGETVIQFITSALTMGVTAEEDFGARIDQEASLMIEPYLPLPDDYDDEMSDFPGAEPPQLTVSFLCIGDRVQYRDSNGRENTFEILEITESARRGFTFQVGPPGQEESNSEYEISGEMMEDFLRNAKLV